MTEIRRQENAMIEFHWGVEDAIALLYTHYKYGGENYNSNSYLVDKEGNLIAASEQDWASSESYVVIRYVGANIEDEKGLFLYNGKRVYDWKRKRKIEKSLRKGVFFWMEKI